MSAEPSAGGRAECGGHVDLSAELLALARVALDRLDPVLDRLRAAPPRDPAAPPRHPNAGSGWTGSADRPCTVCPVCAVIAVLRGERSELAQRLAEQVSGLVALARDALVEPRRPEAAPAEPRPDERTASGSPKRVQRIPVERSAVGAGG